MRISEATKIVLDELNRFSGLKLKNFQDLAVLMELGRESEELLEEAAFTAKYLNGLGKILQGGTVPTPPLNGDKKKYILPEAMEKVRNEYKQSLHKLGNQLKELTGKLEKKEQDRFNSKYFSPTQDSLVNLSMLIYDLSWLKVYRNKQRQGK